MNCETVTSKDEDFFDLSIDVEQVKTNTKTLKVKVRYSLTSMAKTTTFASHKLKPMKDFFKY